MDAAGKVPVKLVKVTRVLGRTGMKKNAPLDTDIPFTPMKVMSLIPNVLTSFFHCIQAREEVSHKSESNLWTIRAEASSET